MAKLDDSTAQLVELALADDIGSGDITSDSLLPDTLLGKANILAREPIVICGQELANYVFQEVHRALCYQAAHEDGSHVLEGTVLGTVTGPLRGIFTAERIVLNFLQRLSGVATQTALIVERVKGTGVSILDTRKTTPGYRALEKYAVKIGGGKNHRVGLFDMVMIKSNHLDAFQGDICQAVRCCRETLANDIKIEVEVRDEAELKSALLAKPDAIMLDNMAPTEVE